MAWGLGEARRGKEDPLPSAPITPPKLQCHPMSLPFAPNGKLKSKAEQCQRYPNTGQPRVRDPGGCICSAPRGRQAGHFNVFLTPSLISTLALQTGEPSPRRVKAASAEEKSRRKLDIGPVGFPHVHTSGPSQSNLVADDLTGPETMAPSAFLRYPSSRPGPPALQQR
jgi:hypothetical protein